MGNAIDRILQERQGVQPQGEEVPAGDRFYSVLMADGLEEQFLELQFQNGLLTCFSYRELLWFNHDPQEGTIDLSIGGFLITIRGRGLKPLFQGIKTKRVAWVKEADSGLQDHKGNETFIESIAITPPEEFGVGEGGAEE